MYYHTEQQYFKSETNVHLCAKFVVMICIWQMLQINHMMWKFHQPKLGRYYPPAPLKHIFVYLPVRPSGLQGRRASFSCGEV